MNQGLLGYSLGFKDVPKVLLMFHCRLLYTLPSRCKIFSGIPEGASLGTDLCPLLDPLDRRFFGANRAGAFTMVQPSSDGCPLPPSPEP